LPPRTRTRRIGFNPKGPNANEKSVTVIGWAAQWLGLAPGTPTNVVVLTSRRLEDISLGNRMIVFRTVASRQLIRVGRPVADFVQARRYLREQFKAIPFLHRTKVDGGGLRSFHFLEANLL